MKKIIGNNIRNIRIAKGITQKEISEKLGITPTAWRKFESGTCSPKIDTLEKIAAALDVNIVDFFKKESLDEVKADADAVELLNAFKKLNEEGRIKALDLVETLTEVERLKK